MRKDDISKSLYYLEKELRTATNPSPELFNLIKRLRSLYHGEEYVLFPTGTVDVDKAIMLLMTDEQLLIVCRLNQYTANLCRDDRIWRYRLEEKFGTNLEGYLLPGETAKNAYLKLTNPEYDPLTVAAKNGYLPIIKKADKNKKLYSYSVSRLLEAAARNRGELVFFYLVSKFDLLQYSAPEDIVREAARGGNLSIISYLYENEKLVGFRKNIISDAFYYIWHPKRAETVDLARDLISLYPDYDNIYFGHLAVISTIEQSKEAFDLLLDFYPPEYKPGQEALEFLIRDYRAYPLTPITEASKYVVKLAENNPEWASMVVAEHSIGSNIVANSDNPKPYLLAAMRRGGPLGVLLVDQILSRYPDLINDDLILYAKGLGSGTYFYDFIKNVPKDYPYSRKVLNQLTTPQLRTIVRTLGQNPEGLLREELIEEILAH